jgi:serine/threonine-protein kinase RsbW
VTATVDADGHDLEVAEATPPPRLELAWRLPRQATTVSMARRLLNTALTLMGVSDDCRADLAQALTEACANAVRHAHGASEYQVMVTTGPDRCVVEVIDSGIGLDHQRLDGTGLDGPVPALTGGGRGLWLIRACTDTVETRPVHPRGLAIRMSKTLTWKSDAPA